MIRARKAIAGLVVVGLTLGLLPLGCGGATGVGEDYTFVQHPSGETAAASDWQVPELVVDDMRSCVKEHASELKTHAHVTKFDLAVTEGGRRTESHAAQFDVASRWVGVVFDAGVDEGVDTVVGLDDTFVRADVGWRVVAGVTGAVGRGTRAWWVGRDRSDRDHRVGGDRDGVCCGGGDGGGDRGGEAQ